ncbi:hypothetical protein ACET3Z_025442 [Daucus carota]
MDGYMSSEEENCYSDRDSFDGLDNEESDSQWVPPKPSSIKEENLIWKQMDWLKLYHDASLAFHCSSMSLSRSPMNLSCMVADNKRVEVIKVEDDFEGPLVQQEQRRQSGI